MPLITTNLKVQFETDNAVVSPTSWIDEIAGINLTQLGSMSEPALRTGAEGTPTGAPYFSFDGSTDGLGTDILAGVDVPDGAEPRTMYVVVRYPTGSSAGNFHGVVYGNNTTRQAFGVVLSNTEKVLTDFWSASFASAASYNDDTWHVVSVTFDGSGVVGYIDNVPLISGTPSTLNTVLSKLYINYKLSENTGALMDCAAVLIYAGEHTAPQLAEMYSYLDAKYITPGVGGVSGTGAVTAPPAIASGAGVRTVIGSGAATAASAIASGAGIRGVTGSGVALAAPAIVSGAGVRGVAGSGAAIAAPATASGAGVRSVAGSGAVTAPPATASGTGGTVDAGEVSGTGAVVAPAATASGSGVRGVVGSGALAAPAGLASGLGVRSVKGAGSVASAPAQASGQGIRTVIAFGAAAGPAVTVTGQGIRTVRGFGAVVAPPAVVDGRNFPVIPVALFRDTAIWDEPRLTATWDEPRLDAVWDEPRFTALWRQ